MSQPNGFGRMANNNFRSYHHGPRRFRVFGLNLRRAIHHEQRGNVTIREGKQHHEDDRPGITREEHSYVWINCP